MEGRAPGLKDAYCIEETMDFSSQSLGHFTLVDGWSHREPFGVWSEGRCLGSHPSRGRSASRDQALPASSRPHERSETPTVVRLVVRRPQRQPGHDRYLKNERTLIVPLRTRFSMRPMSRSCRKSSSSARGLARSSPVEGFGEADISGTSSVTLEAVSALGRVLGRRTLVGVLFRAISSNEISFFQSDPGLGVRLRVWVLGTPFSQGLTCKSVRVASSPRKYAPTMHQLDWSGLLADALVRRFAPPPDLLGLPREPLPPALQQHLDEHKQLGQRSSWSPPVRART